jgi:hypothetical protein
MLALGYKAITEANQLNEYRMSNKVYPPSAAPEATREFRMMKFDALVKSRQSRHPGESRGPEVLVFPGFRLSPE